MENVIIEIDRSVLPQSDHAFRQFKMATGAIVTRNEGEPIELNRSVSQLYARLPAENIEAARAEIGALNLVIIPIKDLPLSKEAFAQFRDAAGAVIKKNDGQPLLLDKVESELYAHLPDNNMETAKAEIEALKL